MSVIPVPVYMAHVWMKLTSTGVHVNLVTLGTIVRLKSMNVSQIRVYMDSKSSLFSCLWMFDWMQEVDGIQCGICLDKSGYQVKFFLISP